MGARGRSVTWRLAATAGLALAAVAALVWWASVQEQGVAASTAPITPVPSPRQEQVGVAWTSYTPVSRVIPGGTPITWPIVDHGVTITFYFGSLSGNAVFTFTPQTNYAMSPPLVGSYFFELIGRYTAGGNVSLGRPGINIAVSYEVPELGGALEDSLTFYHYPVPVVGDPDAWVAQGTALYPAQNIAVCTTIQTGQFGLGGYRHRVLLPWMMRSALAGAGH